MLVWLVRVVGVVGRCGCGWLVVVHVHCLTGCAVGEVLDRIDDDTWEVGQLMRWGVWQAALTFLASGPL